MKTYKHVLISLILIGTLTKGLSQKISSEMIVLKTLSGEMIEAEEGTLEVPENRNNPESETISLAFIRIKSFNKFPKNPVIYLEGGPGSSCTWQAKNERALERWLPILEVSDVILLDQRGTGNGTERVQYIWQGKISEEIFSNPDATSAHFKQVGKAALKNFKERNVDLKGYTTVQSAQDIEDLRKALAIEKLSVMGFSYGTHLGLSYIRQFENNVEKAILVGTEGPNHTYKLPSTMDSQFRKISVLANQDPSVNQEVPDLMALYESACKKLDAENKVLEVVSPLTGESMKVATNARVLNLMLRFDIGDASDIPVFPRLLYTLNNGDYSILKWFIQKRIVLAFGVNGMATTMDGASGATQSRKNRIEKESGNSLFGNIANFSMDEFWPPIDLGENFRSPIISGVETLFLSGTLDFNTPPYQAEEVRWGFANSHHIIVDHAGHEQILSPKTAKTIVDFLKGESISAVTISNEPIKFIPVKGDIGDLYHPSLED